MPALFALLLTLTAASAADTPSAWSDLVPWRTYMVVENITDARDRFVIDKLPNLGQRCEIEVDPSRPSSSPLLACGATLLPDAGRRAVPKGARDSARRALDAVEAGTGLKHADLRNVELVYLGRVRQVTLRQLVIIEADPDPTLARARSIVTTWDVDLDGEAVRPAAGISLVGVGPLCAVGIHTNCDRSPALLSYVPLPRWEGMVFTPEDPTVTAEQLDHVRAVARQVAHDEVRAVSVPKAAQTLLPVDYEAGVAVRMHVRLSATSGGNTSGFVTLDLPLNEAAFGPVSVRMPVDGVPAAVEVELRLPDSQLAVRIRPDTGRYVQALADVDCALLVDGARAALPKTCEVAWGGQWLTWTSPDARHQVMIQLGDQLEPLYAPSVGPAFIGEKP